MVKDLVGYRFFPTGEELINYYLKNKIHGKTWLVDEAISEINICNYEPMFLPSLSKIKSDDPVWYFFSPKEYTTAKKKITKRTTSNGYWKATGVDRKIKDKRGNRGEIGIKKTLVYYEGRVPNGVWTPWVMHEYHITYLPLDQRNYVICQVMYKGEDGDIPSGGNNLSEPSQSLVSDSNTVRATVSTPPEFQVEQPGEEDFYGLSVKDLQLPINTQRGLSLSDVFNPNTLLSDYNYNINPNVQPQTCYDDDYINRLLNYNGGNFEDVFPNQELMMLENRNEHRPKKALSGFFVYSSSDSSSDAESISAMSYQGTSSPGGTVGSSNRHLPSCSSTDSCKDLQTSADPSIRRKNKKYQLTRRIIPSKQMRGGRSKAVFSSIDKETHMVKTEKKSWFITEEAMKRNSKNPQYIYLMNLIIGFFLLLALIGNIVSDLLTVKT